MSDRKLILIVDDTPTNVAIISGVLEDSFAIKVATNGETALGIAQAPDKPDLVLLDVEMPGMDGYEVCRLLKANPATRDNLNLMVESEENIPVEAILMDFHGKEVYRRQFETAELAYGTPIVPDGTLNEGIYIFILKSGANTIRERVWIRN